MTVLVFGHATQVGRALASVEGVIAVSEQMADPRRPADCADLIARIEPMAVINIPPSFDNNQSVQNEALMHCVNAATPTAIAQACTETNAPMVHLSSIDVFDGHFGMPYIPSDPTNPISPLGRAHLAGERGIESSDATHAILRVAPSFDLTTLTRSPKFGKLLSGGVFLAPNDVIFAPIPVLWVAHACLTIAGALRNFPERTGTYHFCGEEDQLLCDFMGQAMKLVGERFEVRAESQIDIFGKEIWPENGRLDCRTTKAVFGLDRPNWRQDFMQHNSAQTTEQFKRSA